MVGVVTLEAGVADITAAVLLLEVVTWRVVVSAGANTFVVVEVVESNEVVRAVDVAGGGGIAGATATGVVVVENVDCEESD